MSTQSWTVDVEGKRRTVTVEYDWQIGRATVRVDGRVTVKPILEHEEERELPIGNQLYVVRRVGEGFDLDISPETFLAPTTSARRDPSRPAQRSSGPGIGKVLGLGAGGIVVLLIVAGLVRSGREGFAYMSIPWKPYAESDGTFTVKFPSEPKREVESRNINGDIWSFVTLSSAYKEHFYAVEYLDLKMVVVDSQMRGVMDRALSGWMAEIGGKSVTSENTTLAQNPALDFTATIPKGAGDKDVRLPVDATMRGRLAIRNRRLFLVWTLAAATDPYGDDLKEYLSSFVIPPPPRKATSIY